MKIRTKAARGIEFGDVSNSAVRNILNEISKQVYGKITKEDIVSILEYFDWKCPYTGRDLRDDIEQGINSYETDHIVPQNRDGCGLNIKGNLIIVDKKANSKKSKRTVEEFLLFDEEILKGVAEPVRKARLQKIRDYQADNGYNPDAISKALAPYLNKIYDDVRAEQEKRVDEAIKLAGLTKLIS